MDLSVFFFPFSNVNTAVLSPRHSQHRMKYVRTHTHTALPSLFFQNWSPLAADSCPVPDHPPFPPTIKQQVQSPGRTSERCDSAGAETLAGHIHCLPPFSVLLFFMHNECDKLFSVRCFTVNVTVSGRQHLLGLYDTAGQVS